VANIKTHDRVTFFTAALMLPVTLYYTDSGNLAMITAISTFVGGWMLGPDLDHPTGSEPLNRWWVLKFIWTPYRRWLIPHHRHPFSHWPVLGTAVRCLYLLSFLTLSLWLGGKLAPFFHLVPPPFEESLFYYWQLSVQYSRELLWGFIGLCAADVGHYAADYLPMPKRSKAHVNEEQRS
jgi:uncharacterized metal-binding protein